MVGKVEGILFLAGRIGVVVAVVGHDGNQTVVTGIHTGLCQIDADGQIAALVLFYFLAVDIDFLTAHDGFEIDRNVLALHIGRNGEMLSVPYDALIVAAATGLAGHKHGCVGGADDFPRTIVEVLGFSPLYVTKMETPPWIEIIDHPAAAFQRKQTGYGTNILCRCYCK